jgi:hypothetical protein
MDFRNRKIINVLGKTLEPGSKSRLLRSSVIELCNASVVAKEVDLTLSEFFISKDDILFMKTDNAPYMYSAAQKLVGLCER